MNKPMSHLIVLFAFVLMVCPNAHAQGLFGSLGQDSTALFAPLSGQITDVSGADVLITFDKGAAPAPGMRPVVMRPGAVIKHPITGAPVGQGETQVGRLRITELTPAGARATIISGEAASGDRVRVSGSPVKALYYQDASLDFDLADAHFSEIASTGRFDLIEAQPGTVTSQEAAKLARDMGAEVVFFVAPFDEAGAQGLRHLLLWADDGAVAMERTVLPQSEQRQALSLGREYFNAPMGSGSAKNLPVPFAAKYIAAADLDGDETMELVLASLQELRPFHLGPDGLSKTLGESGYEVTGSGRIVWIEALDMENDGLDEILVASVSPSGALSVLLHYEAGALRKIWEAKLLAKYIDGALYGQAFTWDKGPYGPLSIARGPDSAAKTISLPPGVNIYNSTSTTGGVLALDAEKGITLIAPVGTALWRDQDFTLRTIHSTLEPTEPAPGELLQSERFISRMGEVLCIKRQLQSKSAPGLGHKDSTVVALSQDSAGMQERAVTEPLSGTVMDMALWGRTLFILKDSSSMDFLGFLMGKGLTGAEVMSITIK